MKRKIIVTNHAFAGPPIEYTFMDVPLAYAAQYAEADSRGQRDYLFLVDDTYRNDRFPVLELEDGSVQCGSFIARFSSEMEG